MKKDNRTVKFAIIVLALTMIALILVAGTYAKYTSTGNGSDSVKVAKWSFKVGDKDITTAEESFTFDLFKTIKDSDGNANETDVKAGKIIAPGTSGEFSLDIKNESEVNAKYSLKYTVTNSNNIPVEFSIDNGTSWVSALSSKDVTDKAIAMNANETVTVKWRWAFEGSSSTNFQSSQTDNTDTALGVAAQTTPGELTVKVDITATQVD